MVAEVESPNRRYPANAPTETEIMIQPLYVMKMSLRPVRNRDLTLELGTGLPTEKQDRKRGEEGGTHMSMKA